MKLQELYEDAGLVDQVRQSLIRAGWSESMEDVPKGATFTTTRAGGGATQYNVSVVDSRRGTNEPGLASSQVLTRLLDPMFRQAREVGTTFTQPVGVNGTEWENDRVMGRVMRFVVGQ